MAAIQCRKCQSKNNPHFEKCWSCGSVFSDEDKAIRKTIKPKGFVAITQKVNEISRGVKTLPGFDQKPPISKCLTFFFSKMSACHRLMLKEKELIVFILLQLSAIALGCFLWWLNFDGISDETWYETGIEENGPSPRFHLVIMSFFITGVCILPLSLFSGCMGAVHWLYFRNKSSKVIDCLKLTLKNFKAIWHFILIDTTILTWNVMLKLPTGEPTPKEVEEKNRIKYLSWKILSVGVFPALLTGEPFLESVKKSVEFYKKHQKEVSLLRNGYCYARRILFAIIMPTLFYFLYFEGWTPVSDNPLNDDTFHFFWVLGVPFLTALALNQVLLKPLYLLSSCDLYFAAIDSSHSSQNKS